jgi:hypothetical protein
MKKQMQLLCGIGLFIYLLVACGGQEATTDSSYTVDIDPVNFVTAVDNAYLPLIPGTTRIYQGQMEDGLERIEVTVLHETRVVMGVTTTVVRDRAYLNGELIEDTFDWLAQDKEGNVWYFGEVVDNYEDGVLVDHHGSWEAGVDGALPGILMYANPVSHMDIPYRQEYYAGEAEDMAQILNVGETAVVPFGSFENVLQTKDWTPLEPDVVEYKFYAQGVGVIKWRTKRFLKSQTTDGLFVLLKVNPFYQLDNQITFGDLLKEINPETGEAIELIEMHSE